MNPEQLRNVIKVEYSWIENIFPAAQAVTAPSDVVWDKWKQPAHGEEGELTMLNVQIS